MEESSGKQKKGQAPAGGDDGVSQASLQVFSAGQMMREDPGECYSVGTTWSMSIHPLEPMLLHVMRAHKEKAHVWT